MSTLSVERFRTEEQDLQAPVLFAIPHAGAGASVFARWRSLLPAAVELAAVRLAGRENLLLRAPYSALAPCVEAIADAIEAWNPARYTIYGQCFGAILAFEVARELRRRQQAPPDWLCVASQRPPDLASKEHQPILTSDSAVAKVIENFWSLPPELSPGTPLWDMLVPAIRADFTIANSYRWQYEPPLDTKICAFRGCHDSELAVDVLDGWRRHATGEFLLREIPGGHLVDSDDALAEVVTTVVAAWRLKETVEAASSY